MKEKRISLGIAEVAIAMEASRAERLRRAPPYRRLVRPALDWLQRRDAVSADAPAPGGNGATHPARPLDLTPEARAVADRIAGVDWYHSIDLPHGVSTVGYVDHRAQVHHYGLPADMRGMRALDVATYDGFWAFELERRGADVVAIDLESLSQCDFPRRFREQALAETARKEIGTAFFIARDLLGSRVRREVMSVYDLSPEKLGTFDVVFLSDLLLHLRDPARAIENVCAVTGERGFAIIAEPYNTSLEAFRDVPLSQFGFAQAVGWWQHSAATFKTMMWAAGFDEVEEVSRFRLNCQAAIPLVKVVLKGYPKARAT
ncbi:MAG: class I SAM-dependent methyltransferase [Chloroflexota bacterium]